MRFRFRIFDVFCLFRPPPTGGGHGMDPSLRSLDRLGGSAVKALKISFKRSSHLTGAAPYTRGFETKPTGTPIANTPVPGFSERPVFPAPPISPVNGPSRARKIQTPGWSTQAIPAKFEGGFNGVTGIPDNSTPPRRSK